MKKIFEVKNIIIIILLLLVGIMIHLVININSKLERVSEAFEVQRDSTKHLRDENGKWIARDRQMQLTISDLKEQGEQLGIDMKAIHKQVGNLNNLVAYYQGQVNIKGHVETIAKDTTIKYINDRSVETTVNAKKFTFSNNYLKISNGLFFPSDNSIKFDYEYNSKFTYTSYWKRLKPFSLKQLVVQDYNPKSLILDIKYDDPNAKAIDVTSLTISPKKKRWFQTDVAKFTLGFAVGTATLIYVTN